MFYSSQINITKVQLAHGRYKVQKPVTTTGSLEGVLLHMWKEWEEHLPLKPSSCTPFLKGNLAGHDGEQSICHCHQLNSLAVSNDSEELFPISSHLGRTSILKKQTGG
jgi:hypothetical protein